MIQPIGHVHECTWEHTNTRVHNSQQVFGIIAVSPTIGHMRTHGQMSSQWTTSIGGLAFSQIIGHMGTYKHMNSQWKISLIDY